MIVLSLSEVHPGLAFGFVALACGLTAETDCNALRRSEKILLQI